MIKSNRLCRIMIKDMKTRISKLNIDFDFEAYWEIIYLILLAFFVGMRFLLSTMFTIYWPKYFYRTLTVIGVVLVLLHLMMAKDISKKEIAAMLVVTFVFMMSHYVSGYDFLVDLLILILGAYRVNFRNILKTYIAVWSVLLVVTIVGAMTGLAENLVYYRGDDARIRMALGINYPTDLAAYVFFLCITYLCVRKEYIFWTELGIIALLAFVIYYVTEARTNVIGVVLNVVAITIHKLDEKKYNVFKYNLGCLAFTPFIMCVLLWGLTCIYAYGMFDMEWADKVVSYRLSVGSEALSNYQITAFGQRVIEHGYGGSGVLPEKYFFIDSSYISIGIKYGMIFLVLICFMLSKLIVDSIKRNDIIVLVAVVSLSVVCAMEHHMIQYWFNPFLLYVFTRKENIYSINNRWEKIDIIDLN